jgi:hypothetical protein
MLFLRPDCNTEMKYEGKSVEYCHFAFYGFVSQTPAGFRAAQLMHSLTVQLHVFVCVITGVQLKLFTKPLIIRVKIKVHPVTRH